MMALTNTEDTYGLIHQILHWATALLILALIPMGVFMHNLPDGNAEEIADKFWLYSLHKTIGMSALLVASLRIMWAVIQPQPRPLHQGLEGFAAKAVHHLLYGAIIIMPVLGWFHHAASEGYAPIWWPLSQNLFFIPIDPNLSKFFGLAHFATGIVLVISLVLHIAGAFKHLLIDKDQTLQRMVPFAYRTQGLTKPDGAAQKPSSRYPLLAALSVGMITLIATSGAFMFGAGHHPLSSEANSKRVSQSTEAPQQIDTTQDELPDTAWVIDYDQSKLSVDIIQMGTKVSAEFSDWQARVVFDPDDPENGSIEAVATIQSFQFGDLSARAQSDEFLNAQAHPTARFSSSIMTKVDNAYLAQGDMTIAGVTQPLDISFTFTQNEDSANVSGTASLQRLDYNIGVDFPDDSSVGRTVVLHIEIIAERP